MNNKDNRICNGTCPPGLKFHYAGLLLRKENGKCSTVKYCAEFPNIGNHSSKPQVNCKWPLYDATFREQMEA
jgi:hypothetical protein